MHHTERVFISTDPSIVITLPPKLFKSEVKAEDHRGEERDSQLLLCDPPPWDMLLMTDSSSQGCICSISLLSDIQRSQKHPQFLANSLSPTAYQNQTGINILWVSVYREEHKFLAPRHSFLLLWNSYCTISSPEHHLEWNSVLKGWKAGDALPRVTAGRKNSPSTSVSTEWASPSTAEQTHQWGFDPMLISMASDAML